MATQPLLRSSVLPHPLKSLHPSHSRRHQLTFPPPSNPIPPVRLISTSASYTPIPAADRLMSAASYCFPLFNGFQYGRFILIRHPILAVPFKPILPLVSMYHSIPFSSFISFFALFLGIVRNPSASRYVRFNTLQALLMDLPLALPMLVEAILSPGLKLTIWGYNCLFTYLVSCFAYAFVCSVLGKTPSLPFVGAAAERQLDY